MLCVAHYVFLLVVKLINFDSLNYGDEMMALNLHFKFIVCVNVY